jgi:hypothetical protein
MDSKREFYITVSPKLNIDLTDVVGKIEFFDTSLGNEFLDYLNSCKDVSIKPMGIGEADDCGNIIEFNLLGFTIHKEE